MIDPDLALQIIREAPVIAFDTETTGLTARDVVCGWVITDFGSSVYVPVRHEAGGNIPNADDFEKELAAAFAERSRLGLRTVGHHLGFDLRSSLRHGVRLWSPLEDTMINEALIDDTTIGYGLDDCSKRHGVTPKKGDDLYRAIAEKFGGMPERSSMKHFWRMPGDHEIVVDYATGDGVTTLELWQAQQPLLDQEIGGANLRKPWQLECDLLPYLARMHARGLRVDPEYASKVMENIKVGIENAKLKFTAGFNVRSPTDVLKLYKGAGFGDRDFSYTDATEKHPQGQVSFREKWLETNAIGKDILSVRRLEKARDSFIEPLINTHNINGRVHPVLHQSKSDDYGVAGARLSCSDPNLQAFPKRNYDIGSIVRPLIAADEGMVIEEADAQQQEPRLFTHYSEDAALIEGYTNGTMDIHDRASEVLHFDREVAKRLGMGMLTMMSVTALAEHMGCSKAEAKAYHEGFLHSAFPDIRKFQEKVIEVFKNRGYVKSILGRRAYCRDRRFAYKGVSRVIQNGGGDHMKTCILRANQYEDAYPDQVQNLLSIHDSAIWQRDPGHSPKELVWLLENVPHEPDFNLLVPIPFEMGSGLNWGEASYGPKLKHKTKGWTI